MASPERSQWQLAMQEEFDSLMLNRTWDLEPLPINRKTVKCKWVYKLKLGVDGGVQRFKARLCAKGFTQRHGIDYTETYSPVVKFDSIRSILSIAAAHDLDIIQFDVCSAFLNGEIDEVIFMDQPLGFEDNSTGAKVCRLRKALYGLKQSSRVWNRKFDSFLKTFTLQSTTADCCVYVSHSDPKLILAIWVDDGIACSPRSEAAKIEHILNFMHGAFKITKGLAEMYVGLHITRDRSKRILTVDQSIYIERVLKRFAHESCHAVAVPADPSSAADLSIQMGSSTTPFPYKEGVGCLQWAALGTRPDISYAVSNVARFSNNPGQPHIQALKRILKYLRGTVNLCITYGGQHIDNRLTAYCDADYAGDVDDRKSRSGFILLLNGGPVSWGSRKQTCTACSTTESEYIAGHLASQETTWMRTLLADLGARQNIPTTLHSDNQSAIKLVKNPVYHKRTKHIDLKYHVIRECDQKGIISITYVCTADQIADILTKPLPRDKFERMRQMIGLTARE